MPISETVFEDSTVPTIPYEALRPNVKDGDILLCSGSATFSKLIQAATNSIWSHVGFVMWLDSINRLMVLESVESVGVRSVPLSSYVNNYSGSGAGYPGNVLIARHSGVSGVEQNTAFSQFAVDLLGYPYDKDEIIRIAAHIATGRLLLQGKLADARQFICSEYAAACYEKLGVIIRRGDHGYVAPADFAADPHVSAVGIVRRAGASA